MTTPTPLSQRDKRWKDIPLGTSKTTNIGSHGCTITALAMLASLTPDEVNSRLLKVNGYANTNLIIWTKINEAIPWLEFVERGYSYDNDKVSSNLPCLVEVDATRIGAPRHWVLYIGNKRMLDPWTGVEKATNYYPPTGYSIIKRVGNPPEENMSDCKDCETKLASLQTELELEKRDNEDNRKRVEDARRERDEALRVGDTLKSEISSLKDAHKVTVEQLTTEADIHKTTLKDFKRSLAEELGTTQDIAEITAEVNKLVGVEDLLTAEKNLHTITRHDLTEANTIIDSLNREIFSLKEELKKAKGLKDAKYLELLTELLSRLLKIKEAM